MCELARQPLAWIDQGLAALEASGLRRRLMVLSAQEPTTIELDGRSLVNFGSNDYLGLAAAPQLAEAVRAALDATHWGSGASPLVCGRSDWHHELETRIARFEGTEAALLFSSGFAANVGAITALVGVEPDGLGDAIFSDAQNHASIIDGCRLSGAKTFVYPHGDCDRLAQLLAETGPFRRRLIVTDGLFSMDGDLAPLPRIAELATQSGAMLMVDEAHATGVFGSQGRGVAEYLGVESRVDVRVGTLSKALGCAGGFVVGSQSLIDWLTNRARSYVFSTAPPAAACAAAIAALDLVDRQPERRRELLARADALRAALQEQGWNTADSASQIIPIVIGDAGRTMQFAAALRQRGMFVPGIRPPSVPNDGSLLRVSLSYAHTTEMVDGLLAALAELRQTG
jgi:8-amino-7-oxononanoate synthase